MGTGIWFSRHDPNKSAMFSKFFIEDLIVVPNIFYCIVQGTVTTLTLEGLKMIALWGGAPYTKAQVTSLGRAIIYLFLVVTHTE